MGAVMLALIVSILQQRFKHAEALKTKEKHGLGRRLNFDDGPIGQTKVRRVHTEKHKVKTNPEIGKLYKKRNLKF